MTMFFSPSFTPVSVFATSGSETPARPRSAEIDSDKIEKQVKMTTTQIKRSIQTTAVCN